MKSLSRDVYDPLLRFCISADTPISLGVYLRVKYGEWDSLALMEVRPEWYLDSYWYFLDRQAACWLSKFPDLPTSFDRKKAAVESLINSERKCKLTNDRLSRFLHGGPYDDEDEKILAFIKAVRHEVARIIGHNPPEPSFFFGPGATLSDKGSDKVSVPFKICSEKTITSSALWLLPYLARTSWGVYGSHDLVIVESNRFTTAEKNAKTFRGIEIQPSVNVAAQLGYGRVIRSRLKHRAGLDIKTAKELHMMRAQAASISGSEATLDLKSASDTQAKLLVKLLLPHGWYDTLYSLTTRKITISDDSDGSAKDLVLERFSAMGCGFTFELETLLFYAICKCASTCPWQVRVFGDDIIVATDDVRSVIAALSYFGFDLNMTKSFTSGQFRESCGGDFFDGRSVRPFYLKENPCEPQHWISYANGVLRASRQVAQSIGATPFLKSWIHIQDQIPTPIRRARGPEYFGDLLIHDDEEKHNFRLVHGIKRYLVYTPDRIAGVGWSRFCGNTQLAAALYGCRMAKVWPAPDLSRPLEGVVHRDGVLSYKLTVVPVID